jgi:uncharacterized protein (TIGR03435 family)
MDAYDLPAYRFVNLEKANGVYVDITATMKPGTTKPEMQQMLRNLLVERFHLQAREEIREGTVYELSVERGGQKLKERLDNPPPGDPSLSKSALKMGADGMPDFPAIAGRITGGFGSPGKTRALGTNVPLGDLAAYLEPRLRAPVIDVTGLKGKYDFRLDFVDPNYEASLLLETPQIEMFPPIPSALSSQLGLRLETKKGQVAFLVIESVNKTPTEN